MALVPGRRNSISCTSAIVFRFRILTTATALISIVDILRTKGICAEYTVDKYFEVIERVKQELEKGKQYFKTLPNFKFIEFYFATFSGKKYASSWQGDKQQVLSCKKGYAL